MEVRWRLFARDVLSLLADDAGDFRFGRPPRPVRGLRMLGLVVHRAGCGTFATDSSRRAEAARAEGATGNGRKRGRGTGGGDDSSGDGSLMEGEFGLLGIGESTEQEQCHVMALGGGRDVLLAACWRERLQDNTHRGLGGKLRTRVALRR